jgi:hypothetical protein
MAADRRSADKRQAPLYACLHGAKRAVEAACIWVSWECCGSRACAAESRVASERHWREGDTQLRGLSSCSCPSGRWTRCLAMAATRQRARAMWWQGQAGYATHERTARCPDGAATVGDRLRCLPAR